MTRPLIHLAQYCLCADTDFPEESFSVLPEDAGDLEPFYMQMLFH